MESKNMSGLLHKLSHCTRIIRYLGYYDQIYIIMMSVSKTTREIWKSHESGFREIFQDAIRIHPYFDIDKVYTLDLIKRVYKNGLNKYFLLPPIHVVQAADNSSYKCIISGDDFCNFTKFKFQSISNWQIVSQKIIYLKANPEIQDSMFSIDSPNLPPEGMVNIPSVDLLNSNSFGRNLSISEIIEHINVSNIPIKVLTVTLPALQDIGDELPTPLIKESMQSITVNNCKDIDHNAFTQIKQLDDIFDLQGRIKIDFSREDK